MSFYLNKAKTMLGPKQFFRKKRTLNCAGNTVPRPARCTGISHGWGSWLLPDSGTQTCCTDSRSLLLSSFWKLQSSLFCLKIIFWANVRKQTFLIAQKCFITCVCLNSRMRGNSRGVIRTEDSVVAFTSVTVDKPGIFLVVCKQQNTPT